MQIFVFNKFHDSGSTGLKSLKYEIEKFGHTKTQ